MNSSKLISSEIIWNIVNDVLSIEGISKEVILYEVISSELISSKVVASQIPLCQVIPSGAY